MTKAQAVMIQRAKANGGTLPLTNSMMLAAARLMPADAAYVISNTLVLIGE